MAETCLCGNRSFDAYEQPCHRTTDTGEQVRSDREFGRCTVCGVVRQLNLPFSNEEEYERFYASYPPTKAEYSAKDWDHDVRLAGLRADLYRVSAAVRRSVLDVGCGSGAFVRECRSRCQRAYGCEISTYAYEQPSDFIYRRAFERINFPVDEFDLVTCHDVLEHSLDPARMLAEMFRVTKQDGVCVVDFPRFFHPEGAHHWKDAEHVWCLTEEQLVSQIDRAGFTVEQVLHPIESKIVVLARKPPQVRKTILVPPGIGDTYWTIVKMQSFIRSEKIGIPDVIPVANRDTNHKTEDRSVPFIRMFPFLTSTGSMVCRDVRDKAIWNEGYTRQARTIFRRVMGRDYFLCWNGYQRVGRQLEEIDAHLACDWHPRMFVSIDQENFLKKCQSDFGAYAVYYFPFHGTYRHWTAQFPMVDVAASINKITETTGLRPVIAGAKWDEESQEIQALVGAVEGCADMTGQTTVDELFGMMRGAETVVGYPSGLTIMAAALRRPTLIIWNNYYHQNFARFCCPPDTRNKNYFMENTAGLTSDILVGKVRELVETGKITDVSYPPRTTSSMAPTNTTSTRAIAAQPKLPPPKPRIPSPKFRPAPVDPPRQDGVAQVTVMCVLKSGGEYDQDYVQRLRNGVRRNTTVAHHFVCLTDVRIEPSTCDTISLIKNLPGWWSKLELFRSDLAIATPRVVYFDLDTVIVGNIDPLLNLDVKFAALGGWQPGPDRGSVDNFGSGLMVWNLADLRFLLEEFDINNKPAHGWNSGDQYYLATSLASRGVPWLVVQNLIAGVYSYKRNCFHGLPQDARVVCFHGRPRPHQSLGVKWVRNNWR